MGFPDIFWTKKAVFEGFFFIEEFEEEETKHIPDKDYPEDDISTVYICTQAQHCDLSIQPFNISST